MSKFLDYWCGSATESMLDDYRSGRVVVVHAGPARRSAEAKALEQPVFRPRAVKPKKGKGARYNRAAMRKTEQE